MSQPASPWAALQGRVPPPPAAPTSQRAGKQTAGDDEADDDFARPSIRRVVPASSAQPMGLAAADSPFAILRQLGTHRPTAQASQDTQALQATEPTTPPAAPAARHTATHTAAPTTPEPPMPKQPQATTRTDGASPTFQIAALIAANSGTLSRASITTTLPQIAGRQLQNALYNLQRNGQATRTGDREDAVFTLTDQGREWLNGGANLANQKAHKPAKAAQAGKAAAAITAGKTARGGKPARQVVNVAQHTKAAAQADRQRVISAAGALAEAIAQHTPATFRCAVYSDGSFSLSKAGQQIELDAAEHAQMLRYLERMAVDDAQATTA